MKYYFFIIQLTQLLHDELSSLIPSNSLVIDNTVDIPLMVEEKVSEVDVADSKVVVISVERTASVSQTACVS